MRELFVTEKLEGDIIPRHERVPTLEELLPQIAPENCHGETDWGPDRGKEIVEW